MRAILFNDNWTVREKDYNLLGPAGPAKTVTLPYDAMLFTVPDKAAVSGSKSGYFKNGNWEYAKKFDIPAEYADKHIVFRFDGVFARSMVYINGDYAGGHTFGYSQFFIDADKFLKYGKNNEIKVVVHTEEDERWYTGAGIYRDVYMLVSDRAHITPNGIKVMTTEIGENSGVANVSVEVKNGGLHTETVRVDAQIVDTDGNTVASAAAPVTIFSGDTAVSRFRLKVKNPPLWSA
jgi:beta-galactosidase